MQQTPRSSDATRTKEFFRALLRASEYPPETLYERLLENDVDFLRPEDLADDELPDKLWEVILALAALDCHLLHTGHLSDRELYQALWDDVVGELIPKREMLLGERLIQVVDFIADGSLESLRLYLKHYADEKARRIWAEKWPEDILPASEPVPYDRDEYLPAIDLRPSIKG